MELRVQSMLKIIEEDADSFAKRAEMYYKRRPELINSVEETYRAYRALAERYDRISGELHRANNALATAFPDGQFPMQDEDFDSFLDSSIPSDSTELRGSPLPEVSSSSLLNKKSEKNTIPKKSTENKSPPINVTSQMNEGEAKEVIGKLQKDILEMQTEKEFIKSSYERGMAKHSEIEKRIAEIQEEVGFLQDEFGVTTVIEGEEAQALMAATALKSCKDTLINLQEQENKSIEDTRIESERIKAAQERLKALKGKYCQAEKDITEIVHGNTGEKATTTTRSMDDPQDSIGLQLACEKVKDQTEISSDTSVADDAEKIGNLVNNVLSLELTVSSQTAIIKHLKSKTDELQKQLKCLEEKKSSLVIDSNGSSDQIKQAEEKLRKMLNLENHTQEVKLLLQNNATEVRNSLSDNSPQATDSDPTSCDVQAQSGEPEDGQLLLNGFEGSEKAAAEYLAILQSYSETKRKLIEVEKKNQEYFSEAMAQVKELKSANAIKEDEIRSLQKTLSSLQSDLEATNRKITSSSPVQDAGIERDTKPSSYRIAEPHTISPVEEKLRDDIDRLLDENLPFWLKFSTSFHQILKFRTQFQKLQADVERLMESITRDSCAGQTERSECASIDKGLRELRTELQVWEEQNSLLKGELQSRFSGLCDIQKDISGALKASAESAFIELTPYQAAKFQGEVLNMKQETKKMAEEMEVRAEQMRELQAEVEKTLSTLSKMDQMLLKLLSTTTTSKSGGIPLRHFLYGVKPKKSSFFSSLLSSSSKKHHHHHSDSRGGRPK